ncbi:hypothetical protein DEU56DRAFT_698338, partial [Suillus clintonianus]|uniref:uncharacterized protein n=1 Tax=Suillus clintonianus TaxID=1904413 RepID=UPI001B863D06
DPRPNFWTIWYDNPGAGTPNVPDSSWQYFNDMGLYIFDCILIHIDNRVLDSNLTIISACEQFNTVEALIIYSKSDQHINNMVYDRMPRVFDPFESDIDEETRSRFLQIKSNLKNGGKFVDESRQNVRMNL